MSGRPQPPKPLAAEQRAMVVGVELSDDEVDAADAMGELHSLAEAAGATVVGELTQKRKLPDRKTYLGSGRVAELKAEAEARGAGFVVFGCDLSPSQGVNLEKLLGMRVVDRSQLIMDLFALRARTHEAQLQVELAQLQYALPRLKRMWTHLDRYKGGIGMRGPGEKQIELDRREIEVKISDRRRRIAAIERAQATRRAGRDDRFTVGLIGYTNAGKSTLFNALTRSDVVAEDRPFSTLDTKTSAWRVAPGCTVLLSDTVGFVRDLPHHLIASFHATLREALEADLLLHVVDGARPDAMQRIAAVERVLQEVGAGERPRRLAVNKVDAIPDRALCARFGAEALLLSARSGEGMAALAGFVADRARAADLLMVLRIPHADGAALAALRARAHVVEMRSDTEATFATARVPPSLAGQLGRFQIH